MRDTSELALSELVEAGRVHRRVYTDPNVFELEMERLFGRAWVFVGHHSQIPKAGDYYCTEIGRHPVILTRHDDGSIHVLVNRCTHRGAKVLNTRSGNVRRFSCLYHGWTYAPNGELTNVPVMDGAAKDFKTQDFGLAHAPRMGNYRGFIFASMAEHGPSFEEHIGPIKGSIDDLVDRAPDGDIAFDAGMHRYIYHGNWKLQIENVLDSYHVPFSHASTVNRSGVQFSRREGDSKGAKVVDGQNTSDSWKKRRSLTVGAGHGWTSNTELDDGKRSSPAYDAYKLALAARHGAERAAQILQPRLHNSLLYPNASIMGLNIHVRVIKPLAPDLTEVNIFPVRLLGTPDEMNQRNIRLLNVTHSASSFVQTDDLEAFTRVQQGLQSSRVDWVDISRGLGTESDDPQTGGRQALATHEMVVRAQYSAWKNYLCGEVK